MQGTWGRGRLRGELDPALQCLSVPLVARAGRSEEQLPLLSAAWPPSIPALTGSLAVPPGQPGRPPYSNLRGVCWLLTTTVVEQGWITRECSHICLKITTELAAWHPGPTPGAGRP